MIEPAKSSLRREMRALRRALPDRTERSDRLWEHLRARPEIAAAGVVLAFDSVPGEPLTDPFVAWCRSEGKIVFMPEDVPAPDPLLADVVIVPGVAFTESGDRLGQGGGWYDRYLPRTRPDCVWIGVGFAPQVLPSLPVDLHDARMDLVVTDAGVATSS